MGELSIAESRHMFSMERASICFSSSWKATRKLTESLRLALVKRRSRGGCQSRAVHYNRITGTKCS